MVPIKIYIIYRLLTENPRLRLAYFFVILSDLLETLQNQRAYPYAEIRRDHVHQTEASDDFKAMDVQLRKKYRNLQVSNSPSFCCHSFRNFKYVLVNS